MIPSVRVTETNASSLFAHCSSRTLNCSMAMLLDNQLARFRKRAGLTQEEVGRLLDESRASISQHEIGLRMPKLSTAMRYVVLYSATLEDLFPRFFAEGEAATRQAAAALLDELSPGQRTKTMQFLGKVAFPHDPVIEPCER